METTIYMAGSWISEQLQSYTTTPFSGVPGNFPRFKRTYRLRQYGDARL